MPNHCHNRVTFYSDDKEKEIQELHDIFSINVEDQNEERRIFGQFIPEPDWKNTPLTEDDVKQYSHSEPRGKIGECPVMVEHENSFYAGLRFSSTNNPDNRWYDWRLSHWDTKWDCYDLDMDDSNLPYGFEVSFNTAWAPPESICRAVREKYPDVDVSWFYDEPGEEFAGYL